jgi:hypothetical protein
MQIKPFGLLEKKKTQKKRRDEELDAARLFNSWDKKLLIENLIGRNSTNNHIHLL